MDILQKFTNDIKQKVSNKEPNISIDIITILTIVNIIYELYKAIMSLYFPNSDKEVLNRLRNPNPITRLMYRREIARHTSIGLRECKSIKNSIVEVLNNYSDEEVLVLLKKIKEQKNER